MGVKTGSFWLIAKIAIGILVGVLLGIYARNLTIGTVTAENTPWAASAIIQVVGSIQHICGQLIFFTVPLIIIAFIASSITRLGKNASKMLFTAVSIAYVSSVGAAFLAIAAGYFFIPKISIPVEMAQLLHLPKTLFVLDIPPVMKVMSALILAILLGITVLITKAELFERLLAELEKIMMLIVRKFITPLLPFFVATTFAQLAYEGRLTEQAPVFLQIVGIALVGHFVWLFILYAVGGLIARRNPWQVARHYLPAYLTAVGTMSSAATLPVALACARQSKVLSRNTVDFVVPIGATIHLCGSVLTETLFCMTIASLLMGGIPPFGTLIVFAFLLAIFAVGAPGVPGGTVMASLGIVVGVLGFGESAVALLLAVFALQDSFGTACNVTGDGAIALMMDGMFNPDAQNLQDGTEL